MSEGREREEGRRYSLPRCSPPIFPPPLWGVFPPFFQKFFRRIPSFSPMPFINGEAFPLGPPFSAPAKYLEMKIFANFNQTLIIPRKARQSYYPQDLLGLPQDPTEGVSPKLSLYLEIRFWNIKEDGAISYS